MSAGGAFPRQPSNPPSTPSPQSRPTKPLSSPVKGVAPPFAEHKRDEVQAFGYDEAIHKLKDFETQEEFFEFLRVSEEVSAKAIRAQNAKGSGQDSGQGSGKVSRKSSGKAGGMSGKASGKGSAKSNGGQSGEANEETRDFSRENFVRAANLLADFMKDEYFANMPLLVFNSTENKTHRGHVTDTECRPDVTAAFDMHWGEDGTTLWPCIRLTGEDASAGKTREYQKMQAISYLHYLLLARPDLHVAQGLLISKRRIVFLFGIGGRGIYRLSADWTDTQLRKLIFAFFYRLYDPGHFRDTSYLTMTPNFQNDFVEYTIRISIKTKVDGVETDEDLHCSGFTPIYATSPFASRTHLLSNPHSGIEVDGKVLTVLKDQLSRRDPRFNEYTILTTRVHSPEKVPGVVEAVYHELVEIPASLGVSRVKHRMGLRQSGSPITSIPTLKGFLEVVFDVLEVLRYLCIQREVLHRDISRGNILYMPEGTTAAPDAGEGPLCFIKYLLAESTVPQQTSALLIDFNNSEHLGSKKGDKRTLRTGTPMFIARAIQQGSAVVLSRRTGFVPAVPPSPEPYTRHHPDRIKRFPPEEEKIIRGPSADSENRPWRHELDHDAESVFWLLLYWLVLAQPQKSQKELISMSTWSTLRGAVHSRIDMVEILALGRPSPGLTHSVYQPLLPLLSDLAAILVVDRHWLDESETRNDPEYVPEAFQRLILQFILDNRHKEFMTKEVDLQCRQVEVVGLHPSLLSTTNSRRDEDNRKRPSPQPSKQRPKRRRLAVGVAKDTSDENKDTDEEKDDEEELSEYDEDDEEMCSDSE